MKQEITKAAMLFPGDEIELHYRIIGPAIMQAVQISMVEAKINKDERFFLHSVIPAHSNNTADYIFQITIREPPKPVDLTDPANFPEPQAAAVPVAALLIVIGSAFAALFVFMSLQKIYKIVQTPAGAVMGVSGAVGLAVAAWWFLFRGK